MPPKKKPKPGESLKPAPTGDDNFAAGSGKGSGTTLAPFSRDSDQKLQDPTVTDPLQDPDIAIVTPVKPSNQSMPTCPDEGPFYIINKETLANWKFEDKQKATDFYEVTKNFQPDLATKLLVQDFPNEEAMMTYLNALRTMSSPKMANNPMAASPAKLALGLFPAHPSGMHNMKATGDAKPKTTNEIQVEPTTPSKRPKLGFSSEKSTPEKSESLKRYEEALKNSSTKLLVWHLKLDGANFDVWGFSLKENDRDYWSWKPAVLEKAIMAEQSHRLFDEENTTMDEMLLFVRAANQREVPCGPNVPATINLKSGKKMDLMILFGLIPSPSSEIDVKNAMTHFCAQFKNTKIQMAYRIAMENTMKADSIKQDVAENGKLWEKLASAANNIHYNKIDQLSQVLCDKTIEEIIQLTYGYGGGVSPSMWDRKIFKLAFGDQKDSE